jgi:CO/xanthine dehydrogenase FAD-binding subunit
MGAYHRPTDLDGALRILGGGALAIIAGGTDFYPARVGRRIDEDVLDITGLAELRGITEHEHDFRSGAATTWTEIIEADLPGWFRGLKLAAREIGGAQVQNAGTVCGNICNASPAADGVPALLTLDAEVVIASARGERRVPLAGFITGNRRTVLAHDELVTGLVIPKPAHPARATFLKLGARAYLVISIAIVAAVLERAGDGRVAAARIAVGACSEVAQRLTGLEAELIGHAVSRGLTDVVRPEHLDGLAPIDDQRGTADYRRDAALTAVRRCLAELGDGW